MLQKQSNLKTGNNYYQIIIPNFLSYDKKLGNKLTIERVTARVNKVSSIAATAANIARTALKGKQEVDQDIKQMLSKPEVPQESKEEGFLEKIVTNRQYQDRMKYQTNNISDLARNSRIHIDYKNFKIQFPQYPKAGKAAINKDSDSLTIFLQFILIQTAFLMKEQARIKPVKAIQRKMKKARENLDLPYLY